MKSISHHFTLLLALLLPVASLAQDAAKPAKPAPQLTSKAGYTCPPTGTSTALNLEIGSASFTVRAQVWGEGLAKLRREKTYLLDRASAASERTYGLLELCESGKGCRPLSGRIELTTDSLIAGQEAAGRLYWFESKLSKDVSLPLRAIITPKEGPCS